MLERSEISFVVLWVLNPIVILFYQNCAWTPPQRAEADRGSIPVVVASAERAPAAAVATVCRTSELKSGFCAE